jgi:hypothetical protein
MRAQSLACALSAAWLGGCGGTSGSLYGAADLSVRADAIGASASASARARGIGGSPPAATSTSSPAGRSGSNETAAEPEPPAIDAELARQLVARSGETRENENALGLKLEVEPRPWLEPWLIAVVNRSTEPALVRFDLRELELELEQPEDPEKPRPKWRKKPEPKRCKLPEGFGERSQPAPEPARLEPGEGLVQRFDPLLYCISAQGESMLQPGQLVTARLGYASKPPRSVWRAGKRVEVPVLQSPPFVAVPAPIDVPASQGGASEQLAPAPPIDPERDRRVKQLEAPGFTLTSEAAGPQPQEDWDKPLALALTRGSDAATERTATITSEVSSRQEPATIYFRRELLTLEVHGPTGPRVCDPQPDHRAPDRQAYTTLKPGARLTATSLLAEMCPELTFGKPGLYLVSARFDATRSGSEFGFRAFMGALHSIRPALVRIRRGELLELPPPEPLRVRVGDSVPPVRSSE